MRKKALKISLILLIIFAIERFCYKQTAGFRLNKISTNLPFNDHWNIKAEIPKELLNTTYNFLGSGVQCYAFESEDKKTVLKVFKHYHAFPSNDHLKILPIPSFLENYRQSVLEKRYKRLYSIFDSCTIAYQQLKKETGLIYLHLNATNTINKKIILIDKIGNKHFLDLDSTPFLLQEKGELIFVKLSSLLQNKKTEEVKQIIHSTIEIIKNRIALDIINTDPIIRRNFGVLEGKAIEIDTGSFLKTPHLKNEHEKKLEILFELKELQDWLEKKAPDLIPFFHKEIDAVLAS